MPDAVMYVVQMQIKHISVVIYCFKMHILSLPNHEVKKESTQLRQQHLLVDVKSYVFVYKNTYRMQYSV